MVSFMYVIHTVHVQYTSVYMEVGEEEVLEGRGGDVIGGRCEAGEWENGGEGITSGATAQRFCGCSQKREMTSSSCSNSHCTLHSLWQ